MKGHALMLLGNRVIERRVLIGNQGESFEGRSQLIVLKSADRHAKSFDNPVRGCDECCLGSISIEAYSE